MKMTTKDHRFSKDWKIEDETCDLCSRLAKFEIRRIKTAQWLYVCPNHDNFIGVENLVELGVVRNEAIRLNREIKNHVD
jgi:hypothetical protein